MKAFDYMDPFHGNGAIDLPEPEGIAATWFFLKAQTGNTHPGACLPYGMVSACAHSGAYVTGYGLNAPNTRARPPQRFTEYCAAGFAHFHPSGTGSIGTYYNYALVTPLLGALETLGTRWRLDEEEARPGYYATRLENGIRAELTVGQKTAWHRYTYPGEATPRIAVDLAAGGIDFEGMRTYPDEATVQVLSPQAAQAYLRMAGMPLYLYVEVGPEKAGGEMATCQTWVNRQVTGGEQLDLSRLPQGRSQPFGVLFEAEATASGPVVLRLGVSLRSAEQAQENLHATQGQGFDDATEAAHRLWTGYADRIQVQGGTGAQRETFYSCLYHALAKPADFGGESPFWEDDACYVDFATMWDMYKTQLPLMLSIYPERGVDAVRSLLNWAEHAGRFPTGILLDTNLSRFQRQARALAHHTIADAYHRGLSGINWRRALDLMTMDIHHPRNRAFREAGLVNPYTHTLDLADGCACAAWLAREVDDPGARAEMNRLARNWRHVYDTATGRLGESTYYEGGAWNYSFRLLHDMRGRIALYDREADFIQDLDRFFGYGAPPVEQPTDPNNDDYMRWGYSLNRFEGYNNEPDIETPYNYLYAGRPDRTAEVVRAGMRDMYTTGRGGLPGNDDSGGLSSCYVWNALGLFPVTGQPLMLIGSPLFDAATVDWLGAPLTIEAANNSAENPYVRAAQLNGQPLTRAYLLLDELREGGTLQLTMGPTPSDWATEDRPPSWPEV